MAEFGATGRRGKITEKAQMSNQGTLRTCPRLRLDQDNKKDPALTTSQLSRLRDTESPGTAV